MLKRRELEKWFPDNELVQVDPDALPPELTDPATRTLLTDVGVPDALLDVVELDTGLAKRVSRIEEIYRRQDEAPPLGVGHLCFLGFAGQPLLALDAGSGRVFQVHQLFGARPLATTLESFYRVLGFASQQVEKHQRKRNPDEEKFAADLLTDTLKQLKRTDPKAWPDAEPAWRDLLSDIAATAA